MQYDLKSKNLELTPEIHDMVEGIMKDLGKLTQNMGESIFADVEVGRTDLHHQSGDIYRAEINISVPGKKEVLRAEGIEKNILFALTKAKDDMQRNIKRYKGRFRTKRIEEGVKYKGV